MKLRLHDTQHSNT